MKYKFEVLVFQNGMLDEVGETPVHEFTDAAELAEALIYFAAWQSGMRLNPHVLPLWDGPPKIRLPNPQQGLGPETYFVIRRVAFASQ